MRLYRTSVVLCSVIAVALALPAHGAEPTPLSTFMRAKLEHSKKLLEALTTEDYESMAKEAQKLNVLTLAESWEVLQTANTSSIAASFDGRRTP